MRGSRLPTASMRVACASCVTAVHGRVAASAAFAGTLRGAPLSLSSLTRMSSRRTSVSRQSDPHPLALLV